MASIVILITILPCLGKEFCQRRQFDITIHSYINIRHLLRSTYATTIDIENAGCLKKNIPGSLPGSLCFFQTHGTAVTCSYMLGA